MENNKFTEEEIEEESDIVRRCKLILKVINESELEYGWKDGWGYNYGPLKELLTAILRARHKPILLIKNWMMKQ
eukprot:gene6181-10192_t